MFAQDRDLLVLEPALLREAGWAGQRTLDTTGSVAGSALTLASGSFVDAGVGAGSVALVDGLAVEVVSVESGTRATVSLLRGRRDGPTVPPPPADARPVRVYSFAPQLEAAHRRVLLMIGVDPDGHGPLHESCVTNPGDLVRLEALCALEMVYAGADPAAGGPVAHGARAEMYARRFHEERGRVSAFIDFDGDGIPEARRYLSVMHMGRA